MFLVNDEDELAFAQHGAHADIASFRYHTDTGMCVALLRSGEEETFDDAIHQIIREKFAQRREVLVAHIDDQGAVLTEYTVPLAIAQ